MSNLTDQTDIIRIFKSAKDAAIFTLASLALICCSQAILAEDIHGKIVTVQDGDTVTVQERSTLLLHRIRLAGIDAPEKGQRFGEDSKKNLELRVLGQDVVVQTYKTDRYGRRVGVVLSKGQDVNLEQVENGLAWHYKAYEHEQPPADRNRYATAEIVARGAKRGLWRDNAPVTPWEWRKQQK